MFTHLIPITMDLTTIIKLDFYLHFTDEEIKVGGSQLTSLKPPNLWQSWDLNSGPEYTKA